MSIYLDSAEISEIKKAFQYPFTAGVTTNPSIIAKTLGKPAIDRAGYEAFLKKIGAEIKGDFFIQTLNNSQETIVKEAVALHKLFGDRCVIKIPVIAEGLKAIKELSDKGIRTAATAVFTGVQAHLCLLSGAEYVIPYYSRLQKTGIDPLDVVEDILDIIESQEFEGKLLVASVKNTFDMLEIVRAGAHGVTLPLALLEDLYCHPQTLEAVDAFNKALNVTE